MYYIYSKKNEKRLVGATDYADLIKTDEWFNSPTEASKIKEKKEKKGSKK